MIQFNFTGRFLQDLCSQILLGDSLLYPFVCLALISVAAVEALLKDNPFGASFSKGPVIHFGAFGSNGFHRFTFIFGKTTLIISKKPGNTGISRDIRTEFTTDLLLSD